MPSPVITLNTQWNITYQQTFESPTLALVFDTSVFSGAEEALFQSYLHAWLCQLSEYPGLMLLERHVDIDHCLLLFSSDTGAGLCEAFCAFFERLIQAPLPEPPPDYPLTPEEQLEHSFLSGILKDTLYAERLGSPAFRGMVTRSIEQLLSKLPLRLELLTDLHLSDLLSQLAPVWSQSWVYRQPSPEPFVFPEGVVAQDYDFSLPGVWFDIGFRIPGSASLSESYPQLLMALCEHVWQSWNDNPALTLLETEVKQWKHLGYVRLRFQGERLQHIETYRARRALQVLL